MPSKEDTYYKKRISSSIITSVISITLVLFTLGVLGLIVMQANSLSNYIKENIGFEIIMKQGVKEADILYFQKTLDLKPFVKTTEYITKEEASERLTEMLGEEFTDFLGEEDNPLLPSIDVRFHAQWANNDSLSVIEESILENELVKEVYYQKSLVHMINKNVRKISIILLGFSLLLLLIALALINNTIRLSVYSKRFIIRSMQLIGATQQFIRRPFIIKGVLQGMLSAVIAMMLISVIVAGLKKNIPELAVLISTEMIIYLFAFILLLGILFAGISTYFAVSKYLRMRNDQLYG
ncbi:MAG: cell division protein FtsX [Bacteroidetes bacterium]|nr:MAG: cell division protein FtsX [Bacteroidota bacterium]RLD44187.1 MAG: cell division protein FtsX [Bacteroidota bacterium]RLD71913.1 MAG: cell division protein FtsX [Bacteroidota bacterium]RLD86141.1 MAG: cell division protein FtsX [Bacteroidota bacterium]